MPRNLIFTKWIFVINLGRNFWNFCTVVKTFKTWNRLRENPTTLSKNGFLELYRCNSVSFILIGVQSESSNFFRLLDYRIVIIQSNFEYFLIIMICISEHCHCCHGCGLHGRIMFCTSLTWSVQCCVYSITMLWIILTKPRPCISNIAGFIYFRYHSWGLTEKLRPETFNDEAKMCKMWDLPLFFLVAVILHKLSINLLFHRFCVLFTGNVHCYFFKPFAWDFWSESKAFSGYTVELT